MNPVREQKIRSVIRQSQPDLTVILENIFDPLNISAVLRSCDAVGIREVFVLYTKKYLDKRGLVLGKKTSAGTFKWIDVYVFEDMEECFRRVRQRYQRILATGLGDRSHSLYELDLTVPTALLFGNEDEGVSVEAQALSDGNFAIPQVGFAESLNISVACAITLFEARRQRAQQGFYDSKSKFSAEEQEQLFERWKTMLKEKSHFQQQAIQVSKDSADLLPVFVQRDPAAERTQIRPSPLTKFEL
ncbi:MAG: RNA methyltransferase [Chitinophagales bacterium]|nr:RNA methyltransferase [Chitinophagales bacterium]